VRRYVITMVIMAFAVGALFKAADETGIRILKMFGVIGIFMMGIVGTLALTRLQSRSGLNEVEKALKSLEPDFFITDWAFQGGGKPDFLLVGPCGLVSVCVDETAQNTSARSMAGRVIKARERARETVRWLRDRLNQSAPELKAPLADVVKEIPVAAVLVYTRRRVEPSYSGDGVTAVNPEGLAGHIRSLAGQPILNQQARIALTRLYRKESD